MESSSECDKKTESGVKKELPPGLQKICLICGDKALGYNFNAISCESCKAFFRRNALTNKELKCPFANKCEITVVTRRFCQKCRLEKCFSVGMTKELIMSDENKAEKRRKIEENRAKKRGLSEPDDGVTSTKITKSHEDLNCTGVYSQLHDSSVEQYDVLNSTACSPNIMQYAVNSTTCSPNSTDHSSLGTEIDSSLHSPPGFPQYQVVHSTDHSTKGYPIDEKSVLNRDMYEHRMMEYNITCDSMMNDYLPKQNTIRSILTNIKSPCPEEKSHHVCEQIPSTSNNNEDYNKAKEILQDVERIEPNSMESILCEAISLEFEGCSSVNNCSGSSRELNELERAKLNELIVANKALHAPIDDDVTQLIGDTATDTFEKSGMGSHDPRLIQIVNFTAIAIRRFIKMAKKISAFKNMCEEDQVALLKGGCIEMMVLRSTMTYDGKQNKWTLPHSQEKFGSINAEVLKLAKGNIYAQHEQFIRTFLPCWRHDENLILIMSAILLFSPTRPHLVHTDVVKLEQNSYYYLLRRYLDSMYPGCEAKSTFLKLIQKIQELRKLATQVTGVYLDVNPLEPLLVEIFDLKHHAA